MTTHSHKYRKDIDGLRGLAVLFVLGFHCSRGFLQGGFLGVDVFFVISGYLIASIIFNDVLSDRFSIARFYERRIKRIFPSLIAVLSGTLILGWFVLWASEYRNLGKHVMGGATFISNILLWGETGYFDARAEFKPLLHLWSLGVEEQFYIFFPLCVWLAVRIRPAMTTFLLGAVFVVSFGLCSLGALTHPGAAFYLPVTRLWELSVGCILASVQEEYRGLLSGSLVLGCFGRAEASRPHPVLSNLASFLGLAMIVGGGVFLGAQPSFLGGWALIPTAGTALVIAAGEDSLLNRWILGNQLLVAVGLISYPLYLWHWPLLFFARILSGARVSSLALAGSMAAAFLLACLTYWCIERPIRFQRRLGARTVPVLCSAMAALFLLGLSATTRILPSRLGASALGKHVNEAVDDWDYPFVDNLKRRSGFTIDAAIGLGRSRPAVLFIGDSHMQQYWPRIKLALDNLQSNACPVIVVTAGGSPAMPHVNRLEPGYACDRFFDFAMQEAAKTNVGRIVLSCYWEAYFKGGFPDGEPADIYLANDKDRVPLRLDSPGAERAFDELGQAVGKLVGMGKEVFVILSSPCCPTWSPKSVSRVNAGWSNTNRIGVSREEYEAFVGPVEKKIIDVVAAHGGKIINPRDAMEESGLFHGLTVSGRFRYKDGNHMRPFYVRETASFLDALIEAP